LFKDFKTFITRGNVIDLAVGIVIGAAFGAIVTSFVKDILMPPVGLALGNVDFSNLFIVMKQGVPAGPYQSLAAAQEAGAVSLNYGVFISTVVNFLAIAAAVYFFVVRPIARMHVRQKAAAAAPPPSTKECPYCFTGISVKATRCPNCTSSLVKQP